MANASISANYWPLNLPAIPTHVLTPTAITTAASGAYVYVTAFDATSGGGYVFGFTVNSDGTLSGTERLTLRGGNASLGVRQRPQRQLTST